MRDRARSGLAAKPGMVKAGAVTFAVQGRFLFSLGLALSRSGAWPGSTPEFGTSGALVSPTATCMQRPALAADGTALLVWGGRRSSRLRGPGWDRFWALAR